MYGLIQPIIDGIKLLKKEQILIFNVTPGVFLGVTIIGFVLIYIEFLCIPYRFSFITLYWGYFIVMILISVNVYVLVLGGLFSKSKYRVLGGIRRAIARVGYEIIFSINMIMFILYSKSCSVTPMFNVGLLLIFLRFFIRIVVELGRTPFDYSESESELVGGFNTEYRGPSFVLLFLKEYGSLLFFSHITSVIFFGGWVVMRVVVFTTLIFIRRRFPRLRYDKMVSLMWLSIFFHVGVRLFCTFFILVL
jgi:NADH:ubiquinone oxidoreductase subunit H